MIYYEDELEMIEQGLWPYSTDTEEASLSHDLDDDDDDDDESATPNISVMPAGYDEIDPCPDIPEVSPVSSEIEEEAHEYQTRLDQVLDQLADRITTEFTLNDLMPDNVAGIIGLSSKRTNSDPIATVLALSSVTGSLLGAKVRVRTGIHDSAPLAANINVWLAGDSSTGKSKISKKVIKPLSGANAREQQRIESEIKRIKQDSNFDAEQKKAEIDKLKGNRNDVLAEFYDFSEQGFAKAVSRQRPLAGLHLHQDEGGDLLGCERYSGNGKRSSDNKAQSGLFRKMLMQNMTEPLSGSGAKVDDERSIKFRDQVIGLTANIQLHFVPDLIDLDEDAWGWGSRHILVQVKQLSNDLPKAPKDLDPLSRYMIERLIPFCQSINPPTLREYDSAGIPINYIIVDFNDRDGAQEEYEAVVHQTDIDIKAMEGNSIEKAYVSFLKKTSVRLAKFALIIHTHQRLQGANAVSYDFDSPDDDPVFRNANDRIKQPISLSTIQKAICLEMEVRKQWLEVSDLCRAAPAKREAAIMDGLEQTRMEAVLQKVREQGPITAAKVKSLLNGKLKMTRPMIGAILNTLINRSCIRKTKQGRTDLLAWIKGIR